MNSDGCIFAQVISPSLKSLIVCVWGWGGGEGGGHIPVSRVGSTVANNLLDSGRVVVLKGVVNDVPLIVVFTTVVMMSVTFPVVIFAVVIFAVVIFVVMAAVVSITLVVGMLVFMIVLPNVLPIGVVPVCARTTSDASPNIAMIRSMMPRRSDMMITKALTWSRHL